MLLLLWGQAYETNASIFWSSIHNLVFVLSLCSYTGSGKQFEALNTTVREDPNSDQGAPEGMLFTTFGRGAMHRATSLGCGVRGILKGWQAFVQWGGHTGSFSMAYHLNPSLYLHIW